MCALCERAAALRTTGTDELSSSLALALGTDSLATNLLIDTSNASFSEQLVASDGVMHLYLHESGGAVEVAGGGFGAQTIQSVAIPPQDQDYIRSIVSRLDAIIDLDFDFVSTALEADTAFYYDKEIDLGGSGNTLGLATTGTRGWELFVNQPEVANNRDYRQYVNLHEWGHSLGLEHPFEDADGDVYNGNLDPWTSAYPEETVMAYRNPLSGDWPDFFTANDINALIQIWGEESERLATPVPTAGISRQLLSAGNDWITGGSESDWISGRTGNDRIWGGTGDDFLRGGKGDDDMNGNIGADSLFGDLGDDRLRGGKDDDWIDGGQGNDDLWGDLGADYFRLSEGNDVIWDFSFAAGDRLEIDARTQISLSEVNQNLQIVTEFGVTTLRGIDLTGFSLDSIIWI